MRKRNSSVIGRDVGYRRLSRFWPAEGKPGLQEGLQELNFGAAYLAKLSAELRLRGAMAEAFASQVDAMRPC